ncbi:hypothetical protein Q8A67_023806 [Cirrhinus molitorella]|uniref:Uncharacterized protein n=1 Tax=Cirrhinus molitorella TaxID=172907 RepID=A0AA88P457_9TELE|nr:hypothetical protein Q8A67_023806 [Cirrhinus molitorella]
MRKRGGWSAMTSRGTDCTERRSQSEPAVFPRDAPFFRSRGDPTVAFSLASFIIHPRLAVYTTLSSPHRMQPPPERGDQREMLESAAINRINSSWEHRPGRTHQFHYLSWTRATPFLLITQHRHTTPQPKCSELLAALGLVPSGPALCMFELSSTR